MKRLFLPLLVTLLLTGYTSRSQEKRDYIRIMTDSMKVNLSLTDEQYTKVYDINKNFSDRMSTLRKDNQLPRMEKGKQMQHLSHERDSSLKVVLTPQQYTTYETNKKERREQAKEKYKERKEEKEMKKQE
ncbi:MAG: hypothetical protein JO154_13945 [Chitinophaga sp.]|uniref:hypothetical protein n=1 Tax=Chitinophaga sp. TaxID=1869181 RepID=UPI0025B9C4ED|nr:hypothetical protein [Chitinophaga sp.]MBV8253706.1 hypothetical protein [Chitinophaga sp.]